MTHRIRFVSVAAGLACASTAFAQGFVGAYELQNWTAGPILDGTTEISPATGPSPTADFIYDVNLGNPGGGVSFRTADFSMTAPATGLVSFDWDYMGFHAWFLADLIFEVWADSSSGIQVREEIPFGTPTGGGNFFFLGTVIDMPIEQGFDFGFTIGGSNFDSTSLLNGILTISNFDAPAGAGCPCDCNFDTSTGNNVCDIFDFLAFQSGFVTGDPCAIDRNTSTGVGVADIFDFLDFQNGFIAGCP